MRPFLAASSASSELHSAEMDSESAEAARRAKQIRSSDAWPCTPITPTLTRAQCASHTEVVHVVGCGRSEEHTSELQSLMRISYAVFCLKKKKKQKNNTKSYVMYIENRIVTK